MTLFTMLVASILFAIALHLFGRKTILAFKEAFVFLLVILDPICISGRSLPIWRSFISLASSYHRLCSYWRKDLSSYYRVVNHSRDRLGALSIHICSHVFENPSTKLLLLLGEIYLTKDTGFEMQVPKLVNVLLDRLLEEIVS